MRVEGKKSYTHFFFDTILSSCRRLQSVDVSRLVSIPELPSINKGLSTVETDRQRELYKRRHVVRLSETVRERRPRRVYVGFRVGTTNQWCPDGLLLSDTTKINSRNLVHIVIKKGSPQSTNMTSVEKVLFSDYLLPSDIKDRPGQETSEGPVIVGGLPVRGITDV